MYTNYRDAAKKAILEYRDALTDVALYPIISKHEGLPSHHLLPLEPRVFNSEDVRVHILYLIQEYVDQMPKELLDKFMDDYKYLKENPYDLTKPLNMDTTADVIAHFINMANTDKKEEI